MPRRNLYLLFAALLVSIVCCQKVQKNRYGAVLVEVLDLIEHRALEPVAGSELFAGAVEGMTGKLDEYSAYIAPEPYQEFQETMDQEFGGVGIEVIQDPKTKQLLVASPLAGTPAYEAGIRAGDKILRINGQATQGMSLQDTVRRMRGKKGEPVTLTVLHEGAPKPEDITIVRAVIRVDSVLGDSRNSDGSWNFFLAGSDHIGYLRVNSFGEKTAEEMSEALKGLSKQAMRGLILDLRDNPGGLVDAAVKVCDLFIDSGVIVTTRSRGGDIRRAYSATTTGAFTKVPLAVLVNKYSASASEIVAACLQDYNRAVIVGQRTWGKGTVQEVIDLDDGHGALKLTTASYWRPSGKNINRTKDATSSDAWGVLPTPGYEVAVTADELGEWVRWRRNRDLRKLAADADRHGEKPLPFVDRPLAKAVGYIEKQGGGH
jgi:carboxyl-terminal processing protease